MDEKKRQKAMLLVMLVLMLIVALRFSNKKSGSSSGSVISSITGGDIGQLVNDYKSAVSQRDRILQERVDFEKLEEEILNKRPEYWSYTKSGSPRGDIQQHLRNLAKTADLADMRVSIGFERTVSGCEYLKMIDFSVSSRNFDMKKLAEFMELVDKERVKYYWNECKIYLSGKSFAFSGSIRVYVLTNKASALFGRK